MSGKGYERVVTYFSLSTIPEFSSWKYEFRRKLLSQDIRSSGVQNLRPPKQKAATHLATVKSMRN